MYTRSVGSRGGARWKLADFVVPVCLIRCSLGIDSEVKHWLQKVIGECSQEIYFKGMKRQDWAEEEAHLVASESSADLTGMRRA